MKKILIMGLSSSGKTTLANKLIDILAKANYSAYWLNGDIVRELHNDWDFSIEGRIRQSKRMNELSKYRFEDFVICDFIAPLTEMREIYDPDFLIWVDTVKECKYQDTNNLFDAPTNANIHVTSKNAEYWASVIFNLIV